MARRGKWVVTAMIALAFASVELTFASAWAKGVVTAQTADSSTRFNDSSGDGSSNNPGSGSKGDPGKSYVPVEGEVTAGDTQLSFHGALEFVPGLKGLDLDFVLKGSDPAELGRALGISLKNTPPYRIEGHLRREEDWNFNGLAATIGDSTLEGRASFDSSAEVPFVRAELSSPELYWHDMDALIQSPDLGHRPKAAERNLLPAGEYPLKNLHKLDAVISFQGDKVKFPKPETALTHVTVQAELRDGLLTVDPLDFSTADGQVNAQGRIDARGDTVKSSITAGVHQVDVGTLLDKLGIPHVQPGNMGGRIDLTGTGNSLAEFADSANGTVALILAGGDLNSILIELLELDLLEAIGALGAGQGGGRIRCAVSDFEAKDGLVTVKALVIELPDTTITGKGTINFPKEKVDLTFTPHPKNAGWWSTAAIVNVKGHITNPSISYDMLADVAPASVAIDVPALVKPLAEAGLLDYIDPASPKASHCRRLLKPSPGQKDQQG